jgi:hypothetical protein
MLFVSLGKSLEADVEMVIEEIIDLCSKSGAR